MVTPSVMLWLLRGTLDERLEAAAAGGARSVELSGEYTTWTESEAKRFQARTRALRLGVDTLLAQPDWRTRPVSLVNPAHSEQVLADVAKAIEWAKRLEVPQLIMVSGDEAPGVPRERQWSSLIEGAKRAAELAARAKLTAIIEPINSKMTRKGFFMTTCAEGLSAVKEVANPYFKLLFDVYHEQVQAGNVIATLKEAIAETAVIHIADVPGRKDPGTGEINFSNVYRAIRDAKFAGYVAMEYSPVGDQRQSLRRSIRELRSVLG